jgi:hypothetical protein
LANTTDELHVAAWIPFDPAETLPITRFMMPSGAHAVLQQWCRERTNRTKDQPTNVVVAGLSEILAFLVPEIAYMDHAYEPGVNGPRRLALYLVGDAVGDQDLHLRIQAAINVWLGTIYPDKPADLRSDVAASALDDRSWSLIPVSTRLQPHAGACAVPEDRMLYDALVVHTVARLAGRQIQFRSGETRTLVPRTSQASPFNGVELVAFPPKKEPDGNGLYTEVVTIKAATFPERKGDGIHILARPSIRNWGPVRGYDVNGSPARSLDVFMPSSEGGPGYAGYRHTSFGFKARVENWDGVKARDEAKQIAAKWESHREHRIFDLVRRLVGGAKLADADLMKPALGEEGLWVLPRLAPGNGDRFFAGGTGVGWPDRLDISEALDEPLREAGFRRAPTMRRISRQMPIKGPFHNIPNKAGAAPERRQAVLKTLDALGNGSELDLLVFHIREGTPAVVEQEVVKVLGAPDRRDGQTLSWDDGLTVRLAAAPAGVLAELLPKAELTEAETAGRTEKQCEEMLKARQAQASVAAVGRMEEHIRAARAGRTGVACAILEMPETFRGHRQDPYAVARRELARQRILPQVVLSAEDMSEQKYRASVADWIRMLGVLPAFEDRLPLAPAALSIIQRNAQDVGGSGIATQAFPLAARVRDGIVECAVPSPAGEPEWRPYGLAALSIFSGEYGRFTRSRDDDNVERFHLFFCDALEQIDRHEGAVVLLDGDTLGQVIRPLQNGNLAFDRLQVGNRDFEPTALPRTRLIRFVADSKKLPTYYHADDTEWPAGLFAWGAGERTAYGIKKKPSSAKTTGWTAAVSRHLEAGDNAAADDEPRRLASMDEICVVFRQPGDDLDDLKLIAHRLRSVHAQHGDDTRLPFPLHELRLLGKAVTS